MSHHIWYNNCVEQVHKKVIFCSNYEKKNVVVSDHNDMSFVHAFTEIESMSDISAKHSVIPFMLK